MDGELEYYRTAAGMSRLPEHRLLSDLPTDLDELRRIVPGMLVHRAWAAAYGIDADEVRHDEPNLRSISEVLDRAFELCDRPVTEPREPSDRVVSICRHDALFHVALLRAVGVPARVRCGFSAYFEQGTWVDHWITERWGGDRWIRDDAQIDDLQRELTGIDFDPWDQPPGRFLDAGQVWIGARSGDIDPQSCGIYDMWGLPFIAGNVVSDLACLNKVELLPWDAWGLANELDPHQPLTDATTERIDEIAEVIVSDDFAAIREFYESSDDLRVPEEIVTLLPDFAEVTVEL